MGYNITKEDLINLDSFMISENIERSNVQSGRDEIGNVAFVGYYFKHRSFKGKYTGTIFIDITKDLDGRFEMLCRFFCGFDAILSHKCGFNFDTSHFNSMLMHIINPVEQLIRLGIYGDKEE